MKKTTKCRVIVARDANELNDEINRFFEFMSKSGRKFNFEFINSSMVQMQTKIVACLFYHIDDNI